MEIFNDPNFWVLVSFIMFIMLVRKPISRIGANILDERIKNIRLDLDEAGDLRKEAESLLKEFEQRNREVIKEAKDIVNHAKQDVKSLKEELALQMEKNAKNKRAMFLKKVKEREDRTMRQMRNNAIDLAISIAKQEITNQLVSNENIRQNITKSSMDKLVKEIANS